MTSVFIVTAITGEFDDKVERNVAVFYDEDKANAFVGSLEKVYNSFQSQYCGHMREEKEKKDMKKALKPYDPLFYEDYTGTMWYVNGPWPLY